ncbi:hypothetical protein PF005_g10063 [Phytophthora fragariae]|uniref:Secreted protein n=1 Tax=Phytophthora fragariae TaxID=53985 RepID=A0A6A3F5A0_9STRA|nr:hypothetical protein PF003_g520 [Phytophthora fragariae]KAE8939571.1 hypothetical protein PF009_g10588 [Phytophthora fragariae]KAE9114405.1 hypothetical protein PF007_g10379 [Phytophthora fragariae]KAE9145550.1 hypothetical protein PF006_g9606 [Phytophthora fragariae]KAE9213813.1 hypothetical protein PF005_g10063 [Phytophthora fragariae]
MNSLWYRELKTALFLLMAPPSWDACGKSLGVKVRIGTVRSIGCSHGPIRNSSCLVRHGCGSYR